MRAFVRLVFMEARRRLGLTLCCALLVAGWFLLMPTAPAQTTARVTPSFDATTTLHEPIDLGGTWLVHAGDDPAYGRADFDDSGWTRYDPKEDLKLLFPAHPEIVWYRVRVKINPDGSGLALREYSISRAFEIYVNGEKVIASGGGCAVCALQHTGADSEETSGYCGGFGVVLSLRFASTSPRASGDRVIRATFQPT